MYDVVHYRACAQLHMRPPSNLKTCSFHRELVEMVHGRKYLPVPSRNKTESTKNFKCWRRITQLVNMRMLIN